MATLPAEAMMIYGTAGAGLPLEPTAILKTACELTVFKKDKKTAWNRSTVLLIALTN
jgi:hypothetical protein